MVIAAAITLTMCKFNVQLWIIIFQMRHKMDRIWIIVNQNRNNSRQSSEIILALLESVVFCPTVYTIK